MEEAIEYIPEGTIIEFVDGVSIPEIKPLPGRPLAPNQALAKDGRLLQRVSLNLEAGKSGFSFGKHEVRLEENVGDKQAEANIAAAIARNLPTFQPSLCRHDGTMIVVGSGPSVADHVGEIRKAQASGMPVMAIKGAHDWLISRGIVPDLTVIMDSQDKIIECVREKNPATCYLLASKVSPAVFDWLSDKQVIVWHAWMGKGEEALFPKGEHMIGGGSTSGLRGISLAYLMGFNRVVLFGFDSCMKDKRTKRVNGDTTAEKLMTMQAGIDGPVRICDGSMASQAMEFQSLVLAMLKGIRVKVVGDGLFADIMAARVRAGFNDW
jgi:uncharacterized Rossmann fold enzyme